MGSRVPCFQFYTASRGWISSSEDQPKVSNHKTREGLKGNTPIEESVVLRPASQSFIKNEESRLVLCCFEKAQVIIKTPAFLLAK